MAANMRAKMKLKSVRKFETSEILVFNAVGKPGAYEADGLDEDNTFATFTPNAEIAMTVTNPTLLGKFEPGETYYVDFTPVE